MTHANLRLYLRFALLATVGVIGLPLALGLFLLVTTGQPVLATIIAIFLVAVVATIGSYLWMKRPESADVSFAELLPWGWIRRQRAEQRVARGEHVLGLDNGHRKTIYLEPQRKLDVLHDLRRAMESKDVYTHGHSRRVQHHVKRTGEALGLSPQEIENLVTAASVHDVGKIRVPDRILRKTGPLTIEERAVVREHTLVGAWMVNGIGDDSVLLAVRHHHERWDGSGYPGGLSGANIPLFARMIAVADAYDAMTSTRPYRPGLGRVRAIELLRAGAGRQFDPDVVEAFVSTLPSRVPVAGLVPLFAAPRQWIEEFLVVAKRAGVDTVASVTAAASAALVIGSVAMGTVPGTGAARAPVTQGPQASGADEVGSLVTDDKGTAPRDARERVMRDRVKAHRVTRPGPAPVAAPGKSAAAAGNRGAGAGGSEDPVLSAPDPAEEKEPKPEPKEEPTPEPEPSPEGEPPVAGGEGPPGDPQPDRGRDCTNHPGQGQGGGNEKHCED